MDGDEGAVFGSTSGCQVGCVAFLGGLLDIWRGMVMFVAGGGFCPLRPYGFGREGDLVEGMMRGFI